MGVVAKVGAAGSSDDDVLARAGAAIVASSISRLSACCPATRTHLHAPRRIGELRVVAEETGGASIHRKHRKQALRCARV